MAENQEQNKEKTIEIKSEEIQKVLTKPPHKIIRYGIYILSGIILLLVIGSCIFSYPDTITGEISHRGSQSFLQERLWEQPKL